VELLQQTAKLPSRLSRSTPARLGSKKPTPLMQSFGRGMHNCLAAEEWKAIIKSDENDFTRKKNRPLRPGYLLLMFCRSKNHGGSS